MAPTAKSTMPHMRSAGPLASTAVGGDCYSLGYSAPGGSAVATWMQTTGAAQYAVYR